MSKRVLILVTDDDENWRTLLHDVLAIEGFEIEEAHDGVDCLAKAQSLAPQVILMDVDMPRLNGIETCKRLKTMPQTQSIPVIFITNKNQREDKEKGMAVGATDYMGKPVNINEVVPLLRRLTESGS